MLLSKVAERVYWAARYLERVESTARLISIYDKLLFDLPRSVKLSWYNLISINSLDADFAKRYSQRDERNVMVFLIADDSNPSSMLASIRALRENVRTTRDVVPTDIWYLINEMHLFVQAKSGQGVNRSQRHEFLNQVIRGCQQILGVLFSDMPHDAPWYFMRLGRNLERADNTSRNIDAALAAIIETVDQDDILNSRQIIWLNLLRSLNADHTYRRATHESVNGYSVVNYLLRDPAFPKSVKHCLNAISHTCAHLPHADGLAADLATIEQGIFADFDPTLTGQPLRDYVNTLQLHIMNMHQKIRETWFPA
jgi:uncharacterized alpha-E superfamily protein